MVVAVGVAHLPGRHIDCGFHPRHRHGRASDWDRWLDALSKPTKALPGPLFASRSMTREENDCFSRTKKWRIPCSEAPIHEVHAVRWSHGKIAPINWSYRPRFDFAPSVAALGVRYPFFRRVCRSPYLDRGLGNLRFKWNSCCPFSYMLFVNGEIINLRLPDQKVLRRMPTNFGMETWCFGNRGQVFNAHQNSPDHEELLRSLIGIW